MKAAVMTRYGGPDVLEIREVPSPTPARNEVLVRVHASSVSFGDRIMRGGPFLIRLLSGFRPKHRILGVDLAGIVESVGPDVTRFAPGDAVYGARLGKAGFLRSLRALKRGGRYVLVGFPVGLGGIVRALVTGGRIHLSARARS